MPVVEKPKRTKWTEKKDQITLGDGTTGVTSIVEEDGAFGGVAFQYNRGEGPIGRVLPNDTEKTDIENGCNFRVISSTVESLDVIIKHLKEARAKMIELRK